MDRIEEAGKRLIDTYGEQPKKRIKIYVVTNSTASSNMSGKYTAFIIKDNEPYYLICNEKVSGCGLDRSFELAYNIFCSAYGYTGNVRYQDYLTKININ